MEIEFVCAGCKKPFRVKVAAEQVPVILGLNSCSLCDSCRYEGFLEG